MQGTSCFCYYTGEAERTPWPPSGRLDIKKANDVRGSRKNCSIFVYPKIKLDLYTTLCIFTLLTSIYGCTQQRGFYSVLFTMFCRLRWASKKASRIGTSGIQEQEKSSLSCPLHNGPFCHLLAYGKMSFSINREH